MNKIDTYMTRDDRIQARCNVCGDTNEQPNKGLGRANIAAWKTRHQHLETA